MSTNYPSTSGVLLARADRQLNGLLEENVDRADFDQKFSPLTASRGGDQVIGPRGSKAS